MSNYLERDRKYLSPALGRAFELVVTEAKGSYLTNEDGTKYLDMTSGIAVNQVGHSHPEVVEAIAEQAAKCIHTSCVVHYPKNIELAEKLASLMPGDLETTFFCNSGAETLDGAVKFVKKLNPGRNNYIAFRGAFHGRTCAATAFTSSKSSYRKFYDPLLVGVNVVEYPNTFAYATEAERKDFEENKMMDELERLFATSVHPESVGAIMIEPQMGEGGYIPAPMQFKNYLQELRKLCDKHGILLVIDEVQSGFARTGKWFCVDHYGVEPDLLLMAKGLSGGMPLGGIAMSHKRAQEFPPGSHGSTFGGNPVSCAASLKLIEIIERDNVMANVEARSTQIYNYFEDQFPGSNSNKFDKDANKQLRVRGLGLMIGLEMESAEVAEKVKNYCFEKQILVLGCGTYANVIRLAPDLTISEEDTQKAIEAIAAGIKAHSACAVA